VKLHIYWSQIKNGNNKRIPFPYNSTCQHITFEASEDLAGFEYAPGKANFSILEKILLKLGSF
jgi:hypothetical protein